MNKFILFILFLVFASACKKFADMHYPNGDHYIGTVSKHKPNGKGRLTTKEIIYDGDFVDGKRHGHGVQKWISGIHEGEEYIGEWANDEREGSGIHSWPDGRKYNGSWKKNHQEGKGVITNSQGDSYNGYFSEDLPEGEGIQTKADGTVVFKGIWKKGKPVK